MRFKLLPLVFTFLVFVSCKTNENRKDIQLSSEYRNLIDSNFSALYLNYPQDVCAEIFSVDSILKGNEKLAFRFLYAYMPPSDLADYSPEFYKHIIEKTFEARQFFKWSTTIPDELFLHFVLPYRVNNENLDTSRSFFFNQLKERLKNLSMLDAAMEVNHWCHEHVAYQAADDRTSAPLATYFNGLGRCGEESTFTVSALRAVGIPARQVYTPRWAHTDDNHAWVEFWADGKWYFFGACEPESEPNLGWFSEPSRRAMLVNTRVIGNYEGTENVVECKGNYSILNSLEVYAKTKTITVSVCDENGNPMDSARVDFQIYNYAEFYSLTSQYSNAKGIVQFKTGLGDLLLWVSKDSLFAFQKIRVSEVDTVKIMLTKTDFPNKFVLDYTPPTALEPIVRNPKNKEINAKRLAYEDSLRAVWESTFVDSAEAVKLAAAFGIVDSRFSNLIINSRANHQTILDFLKNVSPEFQSLAIDLLSVLPEKDLHDIQLYVLQNHLNACSKFSKEIGIDKEIYNRFLLNPHVSSELVSPWRGELISFFEQNNCKTIESAMLWIGENIVEIDKSEYTGTPISPMGVLRIKKADKHSLRILQVAVCRDFGYAARLEPGSLKPQYYKNGKWISVEESNASTSKQMAFVQFVDARKKKDGDLQYYKHFTLAKFTNGIFETLEFDWDKPISEFEKRIPLEAGYYRLCCGNRLPDGSVLSTFTFYNLKVGTLTKIEVALRTDTLLKQQILDFPIAKKLFTEAKLDENKAYKIVIYLSPKSETSKHCIQDIGLVSKQFNAINLSLVMVFDADYSNQVLDKKYFSQLPARSFKVYDASNFWRKEIASQLKITENAELPFVILLNEANQVVYFSTAYKIGIGDEILKIISSFSTF